MRLNSSVERLVALVAAFCIIGFVLVLVWRNQPFATPDLARMMRIILSLGVGVLGATIPGFLHVKYDIGGFAVRAGGASALFVVTFFGSPHVDALKLRSPDVRISEIPQIDLRTRAAPDKSDEERLEADAVVTIPASIRNVAQPSRSAFLDKTTISLPMGADRSEIFDWRYFVNMHEEAYGLWLGIKDNAQSQSIAAGEVVNLEILHMPHKVVKWRDVIYMFENSTESFGIATVNFEFDDVRISKECMFDLVKWKTEIRKFKDGANRTPGRVTMNCEASPQP